VSPGYVAYGLVLFFALGFGAGCEWCVRKLGNRAADESEPPGVPSAQETRREGMIPGTYVGRVRAFLLSLERMEAEDPTGDYDLIDDLDGREDGSVALLASDVRTLLRERDRLAERVADLVEVACGCGLGGCPVCGEARIEWGAP
jgi:hypothetical protein